MNSENQTTHSVFLDKFLVDSDKNLFKIKNGEKIFIQKLKKHILKVVEFEESCFFMDTFGDCFRFNNQIEDSSCDLTFLFGVLSTPLYFNVLNNRIYTVDKYSRAWVHDLDGEIINIAFINENILDIHVNNNYCCAVTDGNERKIEYRIEPGKANEKETTNSNRVKIFDRSFDLLRCLSVDRVISVENDKISYETMGNKVELRIDDHNARKSLKADY